jgi:hypothetical protein
MKPNSNYKGQFQTDGKLSKAVSMVYRRFIDVNAMVQTDAQYVPYRRILTGTKARKQYASIVRLLALLKRGTLLLNLSRFVLMPVLRHLAGHMRLSTLAIHPYATTRSYNRT